MSAGGSSSSAHFCQLFHDMSRPPVESRDVGSLSESPNSRDGVGGRQPQTTNESTQGHGLIRHTCNERPCNAPLRRYNSMSGRITTH